jgi:hypothetical protein
MSKQITLLRSVVVAAIYASLSLPILSVAQANPRADTTMHQKNTSRGFIIRCDPFGGNLNFPRESMTSHRMRLTALGHIRE